MKVAFPYFGTGTVALKAFFEDFGAEVVLPPPPTRRTLEIGVRHSPEQICLPFKITLGNLIESLELGADTLFMAAGTRKCRFGYYHLVQERVLRELNPGCRLYGLSQYSAFDFVFRRLPSVFGTPQLRAARALRMLLARSSLIHDLDNMVRRLRPHDLSAAEALARDGLKLAGATQGGGDVARARRELRRRMPSELRPPRARIGIVGEVYLMLEPFANAEIEKELGRLNAHVLVERSLYRHIRRLLNSDPAYLRTARYAAQYIGESPGGEVINTVGEAIHFARQGVDGILHIFPFTCMPENMALEIVQKIGDDYHVPVMSLSFDEHTSKTGLVTRLEAFVDMVSRRKAVRRANPVARAACL